MESFKYFKYYKIIKIDRKQEKASSIAFWRGTAQYLFEKLKAASKISKNSKILLKEDFRRFTLTFIQGRWIRNKVKTGFT